VRVEVETGERRRTIEIRRSGRGWTVTLDGRPIAVDLARVGGRWSMLMRPADTDKGGSSHEIAIERGGGGRLLVHVDGHAVPVAVLAPGRRKTPGREHGAAASGPVMVAAPMPGRVVKVLVAPGDKVSARQGLVVVEAMKMENELRAPRAGTVAEVRVREGAPVEANVVLVVMT